MLPRMMLVVLSIYLSATLCQAVNFPDAQCFDSHRSCSNFARGGACTIHVSYMSSKCPLSCNLCTTGNAAHSRQPAEVTPRPTITKPDFECGGPLNKRKRRQTPGDPQNPPLQPLPSEPVPSGGIDYPTGCGASVISPRFILTSAYCVLNPDEPIGAVHLGDLDLATEGEDKAIPAEYTITEIFLHPEFRETNGVRYHDIALLKTDRDIVFNEAVFPFCISASPPVQGTTVTASGFGHFNETHKSTALLEGYLNVTSLAECERAYLGREEQRFRRAYPNLLQGRKGVLCANGEDQGVCAGDEGGPLFREDSQGRRYLEGITSLTGSVCEADVLPGVFTAVADYVDFIDDTIYGKDRSA